jgi:phage-related protein (TIGR01555 family)
MPSSNRKRKTSPRKAVDAKRPTLQERALGVQADNSARAFDFFSNALARTGAFTSSLENGTSYNITRWSLNYWDVLSFFETSWVARRIVEAPAQDIIKCWPTILSEIDPKDLDKLAYAVRKTNTRRQLLEGIILGRLFGGAGALIVIKGQENELDEPLNLDNIPLSSYKGLSIFDRWSGIYPSSEACYDIERPLDNGMPEFYEVRSTKGGASFRVHCSRIIRFTGPMMPEPEKSAYSNWGISTLAPIVQTITSYDNISYNALSLSYRAQIIGMRMPDLANMLSGLGSTAAATTKFARRMQNVNEMLSNQSLVLLPQDGELSKIEYSFSGLSDLKQSFQLDVAGAAKMPVSLLWGRTLNGLGQAGDGDERIYEKTTATEADGTLRPALEKLYPVIAASELGEVPEDMDLNFPSIRVLTEEEKSKLARDTADTLAVYMNGGIMSPRTVGKEVQQSSRVTDLGTNLTDDDVAQLSDKVQSEGELGEGLFGQGSEPEGVAEPEHPGVTGLNPASSPSKALKEEDKVAKAKAADADGDPLTLDYVVRREVKQPTGDQRRRVNVVTASYRGSDGYEYRKAFEAYDEPTVPSKGTHKELNSLREQWRGKAKDEDSPAQGTHFIHGLTVHVETPKGFTRHGKDWRIVMPADYGYIQDAPGADGDALDAYVGPDPEATYVYLIDQRHLPPGKGFDETKVMLGFPSQAAALKAYDAGHHRAKDVLMDWTPMSVKDFKAWLRDRDPKAPACLASGV